MLLGLIAWMMASTAHAEYLVTTDTTSITNITCQGETYEDIVVRDNFGRFSNSSRIQVDWNHAIVNIRMVGTPPCHVSIQQRCVIAGSVNMTASEDIHFSPIPGPAPPSAHFRQASLSTDCKVVHIALNDTTAH